MHQNTSVDAAAITKSLELAAEAAGDITPLVYQRLFAQFPEMEPLFVRDTTGIVRGEMLARLIETIFDFLDGDHYATNLIRTEIVTHEGYGVPPDVFPKFIEALATTVQASAGAGWTVEMNENWMALLAALKVPAD